MKKLTALAFSLVIISIASTASMPTVSAVKIEDGIWANSSSESQAIHWSGSRNIVHGDVHSNNDFKMSGSHNRINGTLEYVSTFTISGSNNTYLNDEQTSPKEFPAHYNIENYKPRGAEAIRAGSEYHHYSGDFYISGSDVVLAGLYYVKGDVKLSGSNISGVFTIVAEGDIHVSGSGHNYSAYSGDLLFLSNGTNLKLSGSQNRLGGIIYVPRGEIALSGSRNTINGCLLGDTVKLSGSDNTVNALPTPPVADFSFMPVEPYAGEKVIFDASASYADPGYIISYKWDFGDGNTKSVTSETVMHAFDEGGDYTVTLTVKDDDGEEATTTKGIKVLENMLPVASFTVSNETPATNQSVILDASESYDPDGIIVAYKWDFGDGSCIQEGNIVKINHSYNETGAYTVKLEVEDNRRAKNVTTITVNVSGVKAGEGISGNVTWGGKHTIDGIDGIKTIGDPRTITARVEEIKSTVDSTVNVTVKLCVDGELLTSTTEPLEPYNQEDITVSATWIPMSSGVHLISLHAQDGSYWVGPTNAPTAEVWVFIEEVK
jgi:PKD repeat protein